MEPRAFQLTSLQQGMLFHSALSPGSGFYLQQWILELREPIHPTHLRHAWQHIVDRHEILRASFQLSHPTGPRLTIAPHATLPWIDEDWSSLPGPEADAKLEAFLADDSRSDFPVEHAPLMRGFLARKGENHWTLVISFHHALLDGRSRRQITEEAFALHDAALQGQSLTLPPAVPFSSFLSWLTTRNPSEDEPYWKTQLAGFDQANHFRLPPPDHAAAKPARPQMKEVRSTLPSPLVSQLQQLAAREKVTLNTILQAAWAVLTQFYSGQDDVVFGVTRSGRASLPDPSLSGVGLYITTLPLRIPLQPDWTWRQLLHRTRQSWASMHAHEHTGLDQVQSWSEVQRGTPLFESILVYERADHQEALRKSGGAWLHRRAQLRESASHPLTLAAYGEHSVLLKLEFDSAQFHSTCGEWILAHFTHVLEQTALHPELALRDIPILTPPEVRRLTHEWQPALCPRPSEGGYIAAFEQQSRATPDACAIEAQDGTWTYAEMNQHANTLARLLVQKGVQPNQRIGLFLERTRHLGVALLGILKSGAGYVPLDPQYPADRLRYMMEDAGIHIVVTDSTHAPQLPPSQHLITTLLVDQIALPHSQGANPACEEVDPSSVIDGDTLAYVIYTSGSTGQPKGVELVHRGLLNHNLSFLELVRLQPGDRVLQVCSLSFDVSVEEMFPTWLAGATLVPAPHGKMLPDRSFTQFVKEKRLTFLDLSTAFWHEWVLELERSREPVPSTVHCVVVGGEKTSPEIYELWTRLTQGRIRWIDGYGPTEITVAATVHEPAATEDHPKLPKQSRPTGGRSIGRPFPNTRAWIVDSWNRLAPIGVPGELWIGGAGVARGYLNRPDLTRERFLPDPFLPADHPDQHTPRARVYRTGDLVRYLPEGHIEFLGRMDHQVKIRGFRIELGEVESHLSRHPAIRQALVVSREHAPGDHRLVAYYIPTSPAPSAADLRAFLARELPAYMVPSAWMPLENFPLTQNGKIHRSALPAPVFESIPTGPRSPDAAPSTELEQKLARIWEEILGVTQVQRNDHFFELGGHSLLAVRLFHAIESRLGRNIPMTALFEAPTVAGLAAWIQSKSGQMDQAWSSLVPIQAEGTRYPLFCVHAAGGNVLFYRDLAHRLGMDQPVYGLQPRGLDGRQPFHNTMEEMAASYVAEIRKLQPEGPYYLGGSSYGGVVIWEMAQQLQQAGQRVALLALFDTNGPSYPRYKPGVTRAHLWFYRAAQRVQQHCGALWLLRPHQRWPYILQKSKKARLQIFRAGRRVYRRLAAVWHQWTGKPLPEKLRQTQHAIQRAYNQYRLQPYTGTVHLFRASQQPWGIIEDPTLGWGPYAQGELKIIEVPGFHGTVVMEPCVQYLVEAMQPFLPAPHSWKPPSPQKSGAAAGPAVTLPTRSP